MMELVSLRSKALLTFLRLTLTVLAILATGSSLAWKPTTHVALAEIALADALDDGKVSIYRVNYETGEILAKVGDYPVDPELLTAIRNNRAQFRAGVLGPDAYPDLMTGQTSIHPGDDPRNTIRGVGNEPGEGTDAYLTMLWNKGRTGSDRIKAFTVGYLTHAAGDMFAHTLMNFYAGGKFDIGPNALRHILLEGYIGKRAPAVPSFNASISGVETFIYDNLVDVKPNSDLSRVLVGDNVSKSIPYVYSKLKYKLISDVAAYDAKSVLDRAAFDVGHPGEIPYKRAWIADIEAGLRAWPKFNHDIAIALFFNASGLDLNAANELANNYVNAHLLSMSGLPDAVGAARILADRLFELIVPQSLKNMVEEIKESLIDLIFQTAFGYTPDEIKAYIKNPETNFNAIIGPGSVADAGAEFITLNNFNRDVLKIDDSGFTKPALQWDYQKFAPAYNTVLLTKLLLLSKDQVNVVISDLKNLKSTSPLGLFRPKITIRFPGFVPAGTLTKPNVMLGWLNSIDDDNGWHRNVGKLVFEAADVYEMIFMKQKGEKDIVAPPPPPPVRTITVRVHRVKQIDEVDGGLFGPAADFYARVTLDGVEKRFTTKDEDNDYSPSDWVTSRSSDKNIIAIRIKLYDEDGGLRGADDHCDINPSNVKYDLTLTYNVATGKIDGDAVGTKGNQIHVSGAGNPDRCQIWFSVTHS